MMHPCTSDVATFWAEIPRWQS